MNNERLDLTAFKKALETLERALKEYAKDKSNEFVRDATIQRFEYCYDLSTKMIKRHLKMSSDNPSEIQALPFADIIRKAYGVGIISNSWDKWWEYRDNRAATSHGYNEQKSIDIAAKVQPFYDEMVFLYTALGRLYEN